MLNFIIPNIENNFAVWKKFEFFNRIGQEQTLAPPSKVSIYVTLECFDSHYLKDKLIGVSKRVEID